MDKRSLYNEKFHEGEEVWFYNKFGTDPRRSIRKGVIIEKRTEDKMDVYKVKPCDITRPFETPFSEDLAPIYMARSFSLLKEKILEKIQQQIEEKRNKIKYLQSEYDKFYDVKGSYENFVEDEEERIKKEKEKNGIWVI